MIRLFWTALGLVVGLVLLGALAPPPEDPIHREAIALGKRCEVLFVGPSYVNSQVLPEVIDAEAARRGVPLRSCKYSRTSLKSFEMRNVVRTLLEHPWPHLKLVVLDVTLGADSRFNTKNNYTARVLRWHTWDFLPWFMDHLEDQKVGNGSIKRKLGMARRLSIHVRHIVVNTLLVGRGSEHLAGLSQRPPEEEWVYKAPTSKKKLREQERLNKKRVRKLLWRRDHHRSKVSPQANARWFKELRDIVRSHEFEADALLAPVWRPNYIDAKVFPKDDPPVVHAFDDPRKFPELYTSGAHTSSEHLSPTGSHAYSLLLGEVLANRLKELQ